MMPALAWGLAAATWAAVLVLLLALFGANARLRSQRADDLDAQLRRHGEHRERWEVATPRDPYEETDATAAACDLNQLR